MDNDQTKEKELDLEAMPNSFNDALEAFKKAIDYTVEAKEEDEKKEDLEKAGDSKAGKKAMKYDSEPEDEEEAEEEEEEDEKDKEDKDYKKSVEDRLEEDPEAQASMDVEPFLRTLAKSLDEALNGLKEGLQKSTDQRFKAIESLMKAQGRVLVGQIELAKAQADTVEKIAKQDQKTSTIHRLDKSRFEPAEKGGDPVEINGLEVLEKSRTWLQEHKIDLLEAGLIEGRVNKGLLGKQNDALDNKVMKLVREAS